MYISMAQIEKIYKRITYAGKIALVSGGAVASIIIIFFVFKGLYSRSWSGLGSRESISIKTLERDLNGNVIKETTSIQEPEKKLWDWLELILVPAILVCIGYFLQRAQSYKSLRDRQEEALQSYFDSISSLLLEKKLLLLASHKSNAACANTDVDFKESMSPEQQELLDTSINIIRARTLSILRKFRDNPALKESVVLFLIETGILEKLKISLRDAELSETDLSNLDLSRVDFERANFRKSVLIKSNFQGANLSGADFSGSTFIRTNLEGVNLYGAKFHNAEFLIVRFENVVSTGWFSNGVSGDDVWDVFLPITGVRDNSMSIDFSRSKFTLSSFINAKLTSTIFSGAKLKDSGFHDSNFSNSFFHNTDLRKTKFVSTDVGRSDFYRANLKDAVFVKSNLEGTSFLLSNLKKASFVDLSLTGISLTKRQFKKMLLCRVKMDEETVIERNCSQIDSQSSNHTEGEA